MISNVESPTSVESEMVSTVPEKNIVLALREVANVSPAAQKNISKTRGKVVDFMSDLKVSIIS